MGKPRLIRANNHLEVVRDVSLAKALHLDRFRTICSGGLAVTVRELSGQRAQIRWPLITGVNVRQLLLHDAPAGAKALLDTLHLVRASWERSWVNQPGQAWDPAERLGSYHSFFHTQSVPGSVERALERSTNELLQSAVPGQCLVHGDLYHRNVLVSVRGTTIIDAKPRNTSDWVYDLAKLVRLRTYAFKSNGLYHPVVDHVEQQGLRIGREFARVAGDHQWEQRFWAYIAVLQLQDLSFYDRDVQCNHSFDRLTVEREAIANTRRALARALGTTERAV